MKYFFDQYHFESGGALAALSLGLTVKELWRRKWPKYLASQVAGPPSRSLQGGAPAPSAHHARVPHVPTGTRSMDLAFCMLPRGASQLFSAHRHLAPVRPRQGGDSLFYSPLRRRLSWPVINGWGCRTRGGQSGCKDGA